MVNVKSHLNKDLVGFLDGTSKEDVLNRMIDLVAISENIEDKEAFKKAVFKREEIMSTGIGFGMAIPHVKIKEVRDITIGIGICQNDVDWDSFDGEPVRIVFLFAGSEDQHEEYLRVLSKIMLVLKNKKRKAQMLSAKSADEIVGLFQNV